MDVGLSLLDRTRTRVGHTDADAIGHTVQRAQRAEALGYDRFWVAEHHGVPGVAGSAPAVLLAVLAGVTSRIRLGSAGVMLPHHQPLVVAEQFATLAAVAPGRVDLGVGRSPGFTAPVRRALRQHETDFAADVAELRDHLEGTAEITAHPRPASPVPLFVLATGQGLDVAAALGLPVVVGGPVLRDPDALDRYRQAFVPSAAQPEPWVGVSLDVLVADTAAAAAELALPEAWAMARARTTGVFPALQPVDSIGEMTATQRRYVEQSRAVTGTPSQVAEELAQLLERTGAAELVASSSTHDRGALAESDAALAEVLSRAGSPVRG
ncbi:MsnO8 family LLM class oxidoreductase [Modestobacter sp. Leaf380]|uniref:MsnO8 family LLM class oxidoreductase n=1 Tax=Modestobacter sp. Leaf380 TaxID=1736356 RepID=UPI0007009012|nr:MsnO8 family LLM class oxidoreductase [Modestobacter sp. Leaf380]KQS68298.1 flavin monooxygenase [Modestobacter sp. Leaf380]